MKVAIISAFETYDNRIDDMYNYYTNRGYEVTIIKSDFLHMSKEKYGKKKSNEMLIDVPAYNRNLSVKRIYSHLLFSKKVKEFIELNFFDLLHVIIPPNKLCKDLTRLENKPKIIFDVMDFWPETMPIPFVNKIGFINIWGSLRNKYIGNANYIITECYLFENTLRKQKNVRTNNIQTIYFTREQIEYKKISDHNFDELNLCYLGSINNIIDIQYIINLVTELNKYKKVILHIIGDGEKKKQLVEMLIKNKVKYVFYGKVYDRNNKQAILKKCHFGLNIMKQDVFIGLTMKSIDYFQYRLPVINNISYDTYDLVNKYQAGINVTKDIKESTKKILDEFNKHDLNLLQTGVKQLFDNEFSTIVLDKKMDEILRKIEIGDY